MKLILASASPRRKEILANNGYTFDVRVSDYEEKENSLSPKRLVEYFALKKAEQVCESFLEEGVVVLGADTIVIYKGEILGKPKDKVDAIKTLKKLSGKTHKVITGYALISSEKMAKGSVSSKVKFNNLTDDLINKYVATGSPLDKAGSYGIQDNAGIVKSYSGSLTNIIGLPIERIEKQLKKFGIKKD